jgi:uncharacterized Fe-S cluster protein YjdI
VPDKVKRATTQGRAYTGERATVHCDAHRCLHFAERIRGLPDGFDLQKRPWIQPDCAEAELVPRSSAGAPPAHFITNLRTARPNSPSDPRRCIRLKLGRLRYAASS